MAELKLKGNFGQYIDLVPSKPEDEDMELDEDLQAEPDAPEPHAEGAPRKVRRRMYRSEEYWRKRAAGAPPMGALHEGPMPQMVSLEGLDAQPVEPPEKKPRVTIDSDAEQVEFDVNRPPSVGYSPSIASIDPPDDQHMPASEDLPDPAIDGVNE